MDKSDNEDLVQQVSTENEGIPEQASSGGVNESRRALTKVGLATPALVTLASRPVFGAQCLSQMMSGNMSQPGADSCELGWSPGAWRNPVGQIAGMGTIAAWTAAGFNYGTYESGDPNNPNNPNQCGHTVSDGPPKIRVSHYPGGTAFNGMDSALGVMDSEDGRSMQEILCRVDNNLHTRNSRKRHCIAAYLNASLSANSNGTFNYILSVQDVIYFCTHPQDVPQPYTSLNDFLDSTWQ